MPRVRVSISVQAELKARMDAMESVNWSAIAVQAFEQKLDAVSERMGAETMKDALARLRASKQRLGTGEYQSGVKAGTKWAMETAEATELVNLSNWRASRDDWEEYWKEPDDGTWRALILAAKADPDNRKRADGVAWWNELGYSTPLGLEFVHGFADGALSIWDLV